eukprot:TRINITY_DN724_c0_g1_i1.p1 TRINITY_DN724_c0_g1~~TRINITY_DN724_c0_g1_i1.p1  ORF type:complete len:125 (+),score=24.81 TRINITY_DN724_c0_g1_i1:56-430(+)
MSSLTRTRVSLGLSSRSDNGNKIGSLERGTTNQKAVDVGLGEEDIRVGGSNRATIDDASGSSDLSTVVLGEVLADESVNLLSLLGSGSDASADGPHGLVSNDNTAPVLDVVAKSLQLRSDDLRN